MENDRQKRLRDARRVVIKFGTSVVTGAEGMVSAERVEPLVSAIAKLKSMNRQVALVSSGAVGLGAGRLGVDRAGRRDLAMRQACAAVGQSLLMYAYERLFRTHDVNIAQLLLTEDDFTNRRRYLNLRRTMEKLLKLGVLPIINENDTTSTAELEQVRTGAGRVFSDNDRLAALVMGGLEADALVLLTDVDGLLMRTAPDAPGTSAGGEAVTVVSLVTKITPELRTMATGPSAGGRGGMLTKLEAAEVAMRAGGVAVIANGKKPDTLDRIFAGERVGTAFVSTSRMSGKRRWIAYAAGVRGRLIINAGAREAILRGKASLLSSGVVRVENHFEPLDVVSIADSEGRQIARGIANCASYEAEKLINCQSESTSPNQTRGKDRVLVTRNNIVLVENVLVEK